MVAGLWSSKHAPHIRTTKPSSITPVYSVGNGVLKPKTALELARFQHAVRRLKWKLPYLADAHRQATNSAGQQHLSEDEKKEIETMFKLDFFEYYTVLERALVHLLGVWELDIQGRKHDLTHTYHATILHTLQSPSNPLHEVLGKRPVFGHLLDAKQLRNRWKNAEVAGENDSPPPLGAFEIEQMLLAIFGAFEQAEVLALRQLGGQEDSANVGMGEEEEMQAQAMGDVEEMEWEMDLG